ncbi:hypothetical protein SAMN05421780_109145 [Flexibacter flexilis DSM 6793]|uniref:Uncharacterized protein n=1 Tax=Flexibacter flexilis DSM 6793 TaxID=927664 RepID=A0A1I1M104_9BACT|nr:hypothetical protein [Flexibacter flexilis]SFC76878.1 hypothetical protein SAMN05421780_109145 [Flexibacter flexilis DSM 6793]
MNTLLLTFLLSFKSGLLPPPGTVRLNDSLFIDEQIITVLDWKEYVYYQTQDNQKAILPDTAIRYKGRNYYNSGDFDEYPVLGIDEKAINAYCVWRSQLVTNTIRTYTKDNPCQSPFYVQNMGKKIKVTYRKAQDNEIVAATKKGILQSNPFCKKNLAWLNAQNLKCTFRCVAVMKKLNP